LLLRRRVAYNYRRITGNQEELEAGGARIKGE